MNSSLANPEFREENASVPDVSRLSGWLHDNIDGFRPPLSVLQIAGGQSNPTFRLTAGSGDYILRRKPIGNVLPSAHAVEREFRVISALAQTGVPVPGVYGLCTDDGLIGSAFFVMDFVPGRIFWDARLPELTSKERAAIFDSMNEVIAKIHSLDPDFVGLSDFGRKGAYLERQIARWSKQYRASETTPNPAMDRLIFRSWVSNLRLQTETGLSRSFILFSPKKGANPLGVQALFWREEYVLQHRQSHDFLSPLSHRLDHQVSLQGAAGETAGAGEGHYPASLP